MVVMVLVVRESKWRDGEMKVGKKGKEEGKIFFR